MTGAPFHHYVRLELGLITADFYVKPGENHSHVWELVAKPVAPAKI